MKYRTLRIAWSVVSGMCCVLVIVLWVRSYWQQDLLAVRMGKLPTIGGLSCDGILTCGFDTSIEDGDRIIAQSLKFKDHPWLLDRIETQRSPSGYSIAPITGGGWRVEIPHYLAFVAFGIGVAAPWVRWRFSLRTLLLTTTAVAVLLGLIVYATRG